MGPRSGWDWRQAYLRNDGRRPEPRRHVDAYRAWQMCFSAAHHARKLVCSNSRSSRCYGARGTFKTPPAAGERFRNHRPNELSGVKFSSASQHFIASVSITGSALLSDYIEIAARVVYEAPASQVPGFLLTAQRPTRTRNARELCISDSR